MKRFAQSRLGWLVGFVVAIVAVACSAPHAAFAMPLIPGVTTTTDSLTNIMKVVYSDPLIVDIVNESELLDMFQQDFNVKTEETTGGRYVEMAHYLRLAGAAGARAENDYIPVPQSPRNINSHLSQEGDGRGRDVGRRDGEGGER
jgi:hypothetical protein